MIKMMLWRKKMKKVAKLGFYGMMKMKTVKKFNQIQEWASIYFIRFMPFLRESMSHDFERYFVTKINSLIAERRQMAPLDSSVILFVHFYWLSSLLNPLETL